MAINGGRTIRQVQERLLEDIHVIRKWNGYFK